ncbi:MAG: DUF2974 domain-containing protein [bacterium]|nr:DUF2974 domain-containing protein [bacterium]
MVNTLDLARMANDSYKENSTELLGKWVRQDKPKKFGNFYACAYKRDGAASTVTVAFRGTDDLEDGLVDDVTGIGLGLNAHVMDLNAAIEYASMWKYNSRSLWLTGHSLGGAYVQLVGSIIDVPGASFNAPGVMNLLNQMSSNWARRIVSGALHTLTLGKIAYFTGSDEGAVGAIMNYRGEWDPVSRVGAHVGSLLQTIKVSTLKPHPHSMLPIIEALKKRGA